MVDELVGGIVRGIFSLIHAIFQIIFEAFVRALFQFIIEMIVSIVSPIFRTIRYFWRLVLWTADRAYLALFQRVRCKVRPAMLAHGLVVLLLMVCGFITGASASTVYHHVHPVHHSTTVGTES